MKEMKINMSGVEYTAPQAEVLVLKYEGIVCASPKNSSFEDWEVVNL